MYEGNVISRLNAGEDAQSVLTDYYKAIADNRLTAAYQGVAKGLAVAEEQPRGMLAASLRRHLNVIIREQESRKEAATA